MIGFIKRLQLVYSVIYLTFAPVYATTPKFISAT